MKLGPHSSIGAVGRHGFLKAIAVARASVFFMPLLQSSIHTGWFQEGQVTPAYALGHITGGNLEHRKPKSSIADSKHARHWLQRETLFLFSQTIHDTNILEKVVHNEGQVSSLQNGKQSPQRIVSQYIFSSFYVKRIPHSSPMYGKGGFPHNIQQGSHRHQPSVLQFNSVLTPSTRRWHQIPQGKG